MELTSRFILVYRKTRLAELVERFNTVQQARFYLEQSGADFHDYMEEDRIYGLALEFTRRTLAELGSVQMLERAMLPSYLFRADDYVVVIGQDGLVANTLKYLDGHAVIALNPDSRRWDGILLPFKPADILPIVTDVMKQRRTCREITFAKATTNDGQSLLAVNDLFIGPKTHTSARYTLELGGVKEQQSSSGIIVSTGLGSTGWYQSVLAGAHGVCRSSSSQAVSAGFAWDSDFLMYSVREPFPSKLTGVSLVHGRINYDNPLIIESLMPENGVIFSDGIESDYLPFNAGSRVTIAIAEQKGHLVV